MKRKYSEIDFSLKEKYEMERLRGTELLQEIERWKARYMAAEKSKAKELDDLRLMMESQRKSMLDREMRELTIKFQADRGNLENEIRKLR
jgi:predicted  nucleic acid-binding Zn-ribbon protein